ncbi:eukaryotic initiation factor 2alpha kinase 1 [Cryptosporidium felis]|nr:eukaryotic initiation factor 2alpha kinase 1 [Cryptosporidium felis]
MNSLIEELESISKDEYTIIHILDFGFIRNEGSRIYNLLSISNYNYNSSGSLVLFEDYQSSKNNSDGSDYFLIDNTLGEDSNALERDLSLTILIGSHYINNSNFISEETRKANSVLSPRGNNISLHKSRRNQDPSYDKKIFGLRNKERFIGVEIEVTINKQYPDEPFNVFYLSYHNLDKNSKEKIRQNVDLYLKGSKSKYFLSQLVASIKHSLQEINHFRETEIEEEHIKLNHTKSQNISCKRDEDYQLTTYRQVQELEGTYMLSSNRFEDNFEIIEVLGYGGFGSVFMVRENFGGKCIYAIKQIPLSSRHIHENQLLINEAAMLACLNNEKIVRYYHAWVQESVDGQAIYINNELLNRNIFSSFAPELLSQFSAMTAQYISNETANNNQKVKKESQGARKSIYLYIQMEYCSGYSLQYVIDKGLLFNNHKLIWHIFYQIIQGLSYLHGKGVIHRDLKPSNIFLQINENNFIEAQSNNWYLVKLGDFGLTTFVDIFEKCSYSNKCFNSHKSNKELSSGVGTLFYMAPEQSKGNIYNQSADMFSLGVILFEMYHPSFNTSMERVQILSELTKNCAFPLNCDIPKKVRTLIKSLLNPNPEERPTSYQLLYNEWILKQAKFYLNCEDSKKYLNSDFETVSFWHEYSSQKICDIISRNPYIHENIQILNNLFSIEKRLDKQMVRNNRYFSYFPFQLSTINYKRYAYQIGNIFLKNHYYYKKRSELITSIKNIFRTHGATEVDIPILIPKISSKNTKFDKNMQNEIDDSKKMLNLDIDYLILSNNKLTQKGKQRKNKKGKKSYGKNDFQNNKDFELSENIAISDNPLTVVLLNRNGNPLILCNSILKSMSAQFGDGQNLRLGAVIKRFYIDSIFTQDNCITSESGNNGGWTTHGHPKEVLFGAYEIIVRMNDRIIEEFDSDLNYSGIPIDNQLNGGNLRTSPVLYNNIVIYYDIEAIITALDTLRPCKNYIGETTLVWGDSQLFIALLESWTGIKYDKAKYLQLWLQNAIPRRLSRIKFLNVLQKIALISLAEYANSYCLDRELETGTTVKSEAQDNIVRFYIGLKILSYPSILEKVVDNISFIINNFVGSIQDLIEIVNKGTIELMNLFEMEKKKFIVTCKNEHLKKMAQITRYPLYLNLFNNSGFNNVNIKPPDDKSNEEKYHKYSEVILNSKYITPNLLKVFFRILSFDNLLNNTELDIAEVFFDPILFSSNNFFESGFFFYIFSGEISNQSYPSLNAPSFDKSSNRSICKVGCIMGLMSENKQTSNNTNVQIFSKRANVELLIKGGRFDNWYTKENKKMVFFNDHNSDRITDIVSVVGFEIVLERLICKILNNAKYKSIGSILSTNVLNTGNMISKPGIQVFILNSSTKYQMKSFKLKQVLILKGIKCQRNISCNITDLLKFKNNLKSRLSSLQWIVHIVRTSVNDGRRHQSANSSSIRSPSLYLANNSSYVNSTISSHLVENQNNSAAYSEIKYKLEWCLYSDSSSTSNARELIQNYSTASSLNNLEIVFDNELSIIQFLVEFYCFGD